MKILALESSAIAASVAVFEDDTLLGEYTLNNRNTHSQTLLPMLESLLQQLNCKPNDIDLYAIAEGPGSFTGVRIGAATLKGLAFGKEKICIGVSTLEALAYNLPIPNGLICPVMNARRSQVYTALFRMQDGKPVRLMPDSAISIAELDQLLAQYDEPVYLTGDGYEITSKALTHPTGVTPERLRHQSAASVACAAYHAYLQGLRTTDFDIRPVYLRPCQAERERAEREAQQAQA